MHIIKIFLYFQWYNILFWLWIPLLFLNVLSGYIFFVNDFEKPAIWISIYAAIYRHVWGLGIAFILLGFGFRVGCKFFKKIPKL